MVHISKQKHVIKELDEIEAPTENQTICQVICSSGNNLFKVKFPCGKECLASLLSKYRKFLWVQRNSYVITEPILEGDKVKAEIVSVLYEKQIKYLMELGVWPECFLDKPSIRKIYDKVLRLKNESLLQQTSNNDDDDMLGFAKFDRSKQLYGLITSDNSDSDESENETDSDESENETDSDESENENDSDESENETHNGNSENKTLNNEGEDCVSSDKCGGNEADSNDCESPGQIRRTDNTKSS